MWGFSKSGSSDDDQGRVVPDATDPVNISTGNIDNPAIDVSEPVRDEWREQLAHLGGPNPLLHFPRDTAIEFSVGHPGGLAQLFSGSPTLLRTLVRDDLALQRARHNAIRINDKGIELQASRGIDSVFLAVGLVTWTTDDTFYCAPMLVRPVRLRRRADDIEITLQGGLRLNPALARELYAQFGIGLDERAFVALTDDNGSFRPNGALDRLQGLIAHIPGANVVPALAIANLSDVAADMVGAATHLNHPILDALSGNGNAVSIVSESHAAIDPGDVDTRSLNTDTLVLDADTEQELIVAHIVAGNSIVVGTPSGSGATQTIVNSVAELVRTGKSVLIVGSRRSRLDSIRRRLRGLGLDGLAVTPRNLRADLIRAISRNESAVAPHSADVDAALTRMRTILRDYRGALAQVDSRVGVSVLDAIRELSALATEGGPATNVSLPADAVVALAGRLDVAADTLNTAASLGEFRYGPNDSPWYTARFESGDDAAVAHQCARTLHDGSLGRLIAQAGEVLGQSSLGISNTVAGIAEREALLEGIRDTLDSFSPEIFDRPLDDLVAAHAADQRHSGIPAIHRRRLKKLAKEFVRPGAHVEDMFAALERAHHQRTEWEARVPTGERPSVPAGITELSAALDSVDRNLAVLDSALGRDLRTLPLSELSDLVAELAKDSEVLNTLHERSEVSKLLREWGLGDLLADLADRHIEDSHVRAELELAWWRGVLEMLIADRHQLLGADARILDRLENDFRMVDAAHIAANAQRIARALADAWRIAIVDFADEAGQLRAMLKDGQVTSRMLASRAPNLARILAPVWAISPYDIAALDPAQRFDAVVLVDAGAITVAEAAPSIARGTQIVAFGDPITDHPIAFSLTPHDEADRTLGAISILSRLADYLPTHALTQSYRALGTDLADSINRHLYSGGVTGWTLAASALGAVGLVIENVAGTAMPDDDSGRIEGTEAEVISVVRRVLDHARNHASESLMVISPSAVHVSRIQDALLAAIPVNRELQDFLADPALDPFVVLTLDQASAVTRDRVIFSVGYGRTPHGRILSDLGPLSTVDGERLVAVAVTRAHTHLRIITSLTAEDLQIDRMAPGPRMLGRFIEDTLSFTPEPAERNALLADLARRLESRGLRILPATHDIPLAVVAGETPVAIDIDDVLMAQSLRTGIRTRPLTLTRFGWTYVRVHALELFMDPDGVADRIVATVDVNATAS
ncbi:uncharacterized protein DUF4011 [Microbacteriaceae bacterium MWH-Ta3]|nr:uncharacterized protein DUF4011 [Microbacteriaceae bacterium MWH-Ta3]